MTGAVDVKVTENYSTSSFILSCKVGYPKKLLPDAGSQLVKGCKLMKLTFLDVHSKLNELGVGGRHIPWVHIICTEKLKGK